MPDDQHPINDGPYLDPRLKEFIERVIVPILVKEYLAQSQETEMRKVSGPALDGDESEGKQ